MGVRRITNRGGKKVIGKFPSQKTKSIVEWESQLERDYIYLIESDPEVITYDSQPLKIRYRHDGQQRIYTPDFRIIRLRAHAGQVNKQLVEVKPEAELSRGELQHLYRTVQPLCLAHGYEFLVVTDTMIRQQPRLDNIKLLHKYARVTVLPQYEVFGLKAFEAQQFLTLRDLTKDFAVCGIPRGVVFSMLYRGILKVDLMQPIQGDSLVWFCGGLNNVESEAS